MCQTELKNINLVWQKEAADNNLALFNELYIYHSDWQHIYTLRNPFT